MNRKTLTGGAILLLFVLATKIILNHHQTHQPVPLIDGLQSRSSFAQTMNDLHGQGQGFKIIENSGLSLQDKRPPFNILTIDLPHYSFQKVPGHLTLYFFNDRLISTYFYPQNFKKDAQKLSHAIGFDITKSQTHLINNAEVKSTTNLKRQEYIFWRDPNLTEEQSAWTRTYS